MRNRAGEETAVRIADAARQILAESGLEAATVKAICDRARVRPGSFYNLFDSKETVILEVIRQAIVAVDPDPQRTGSDHVTDLVEAFVRFVEDQPELARVYVTVGVSGGITDPGIRARMLRHHSERVERFTSALLRDRPEMATHEARRTIEALLAALNGYTLQRMLDPEFDFAGHARALMELEPR
ncbi:MAG TPA: helix-turn-helix domain-containing protein [Acidimicrobiia bacterium]|nr:helix-turn-helix domain-containing protein [Acidimicrobiia bacterium]